MFDVSLDYLTHSFALAYILMILKYFCNSSYYISLCRISFVSKITVNKRYINSSECISIQLREQFTKYYCKTNKDIDLIYTNATKNHIDTLR